MRLWTIVPVAVLLLCATVLAAAWRENARAIPPAAPSGMELLRSYSCLRGESKVVLVRGIEDGFSPAGHEPGFLRPGLDIAKWKSIGTGIYDQSERDRKFIDSLQLPARIRNGLLVVGLRPLAVVDSGNDGFTIGDMRSDIRFGDLITNLPGWPGWKREGALYFVTLDHIILNSISPMKGRTLLEFLGGDDEPRWVDVHVHDDTSIDFVGIAACVAPPRGKGTPLMTDNRQPPSGFVALTCSAGPDDWAICDQYVGDTPCETALPIACLLPGRSPAPPELAAFGLVPAWSGGDIAMTGPVPAARFRDVGEVDAYCAAQFGEGWRTLASHDGLPNFTVVGRGAPPPHPVRAWVDQVNQPYATCWSR